MCQHFCHAVLVNESGRLSAHRMVRKQKCSWQGKPCAGCQTVDTLEKPGRMSLWIAQILALLAPEGAPAEGPLAEAIFRSLLTQIYDGRLAAGAVLNEAALAEEYRRKSRARARSHPAPARLQARHARAVPARAGCQLTPDFVRQLSKCAWRSKAWPATSPRSASRDEELRQIGARARRVSRADRVLPSAQSGTPGRGKSIRLPRAHRARMRQRTHR